MTVFIIDDDSRNIFALSAVLKARGHAILSASGMDEAFALLQKDATTVDVILLDMMMPDMDGFAALPALKENPAWRHIPVIAVTAKAMSGDREKCIAAGADEYLSKPVDIDKLTPLLNQYKR